MRKQASGETAVTSGETAGTSGDLDESRLVAWRHVRSVSETVVERISTEMETRSGVSLDWYELLLQVWEGGQGRLLQSELKRHSRLSQSGISRMVSKMEQAGLLQREPVEHDRRNVEVVMTEAGKDVFLRATPIHNAAVQHHFGAWLSEKEIAAINGGLKKVARAGGRPDGADQDQLDQYVTFGKTVLALTSDSVTVSDAILVRDALEPLVLTDAARHITSDGVNELRRHVTAMSALIDDPAEFFRTDWKLHRVIATYCENQLLRDGYLNLLDIISSHLDNVVPTSNLDQYLHERLAVHARLVDAVASGDKHLVAQAAERHHFTSVRSRLIDTVSSDAAGP
ncbi:FCD domain-containing protein [Spirillospora sp. CA-255316]